jgi:hypothetical protein
MAKPITILVRFIKPFAMYSAGEEAAFDPPVAWKLVNKDHVAELTEPAKVQIARQQRLP